MNTETDPIEFRNFSLTVTFDGQTRTIAARNRGDRASSRALEVYGVFPTGTKAHRAHAEFWNVASMKRAPASHAVIATDEDGGEWVLDTRLYTHNRNVGRIVGWADDVTAPFVARW